MNTNNPPRDADEFLPDLKKSEDAIAKWKGEDVTDENAPQLHLDIEYASSVKKEADAAHKAIKEPFLVGGRKVDDAFRPVKSGAEDGVKGLKCVLSKYLAEKQRIQDEIARKAREEAERIAAEAAKDADDPLLGDTAEQSVKEAEVLAKRAERHAENASSSVVSGARTIGLRTYYVAVVEDSAALVAHYAAHPDVIAAATKLANADVRSLKSDAVIPGVRVSEEQRAA